MSSHDRQQEKWGVVEEALPNRQFRVKIEGTEKVVLCYLAGKLAKNFIRVLIGDRVKVFCPPQGNICRLTFRPSAER